MTREEAAGKINAIKKYLTAGNPIWDVREIDEALNMAIEALKQEPVVRCKDCIHRYATGDVTKYYVCDFMDAQYEDNGYCHHGEREEE